MGGRLRPNNQPFEQVLRHASSVLIILFDLPCLFLCGLAALIAQLAESRSPYKGVGLGRCYKMEQETQQLIEQAEDPWVDLLEDDFAELRKRDRGGGGEAPLQSMKVFRIVECINLSGVEFDYQDVLELGVQGVLAKFGIYCCLTEDEHLLLWDALAELGGHCQTQEMLRVSDRDDYLLPQIGYRTFSLRDEAAFRKAYLAGLRKKHRGAFAAFGTSNDYCAGGAHSKMSIVPEVHKMKEVNEVGGVNGMTSRQHNCIRVLCRKLDKPVPIGVDDWTRRQASECIEELGRQIDSQVSFESAGQLQLHGAAGGGVAVLSRDAQVRLGLAAKLVHQQWALARKKPINGAQEEFKKQVVDLYGLLGEVEQQIAAAPIAPASFPVVSAGGVVGGEAHA